MDDKSRIRYTWERETGKWVRKMTEAKIKVEGSDKTRGRKVVNFDFKQGEGSQASGKKQRKAGLGASTEAKGREADSSLVGSSVQRRSSGSGVVELSSAHFQDVTGPASALVAPSFGEGLTLKSTPLLTSGANLTLKADEMTDQSCGKRRRAAQAPIADEGTVAAESDREATNPSSNTTGRPGIVAPVKGDRLVLGGNCALFSPREEATMSGTMRSGTTAGGTSPAGLALVMDIDLKPRGKSLELQENRGAKPKIQSVATLTTTTAAAERSGGVISESNKAPKQKERPKIPDRRERSRKVAADAGSVGMTASGGFGCRIVASETSEVDARQAQDKIVEEAEKRGPMGRKRKLEMPSIHTQSEAAAGTEGRPKRLRRAPRWYTDQ
ncbi:hypothetical protein AJ78_08309 [Emergomyces pasteurianus Ep9510]|uniref:Uncharacterized protein n=1 Tax=Emergomyces pasteurianus Ep9510 TaxID=1447872 RepID=A0A1J9Q3A8_9EURO|nr:hypothetical protein AJ78_08309 [Emergomyces pasteurianus Ep9510]